MNNAINSANCTLSAAGFDIVSMAGSSGDSTARVPAYIFPTPRRRFRSRLRLESMARIGLEPREPATNRSGRGWVARRQAQSAESSEHVALLALTLTKPTIMWRNVLRLLGCTTPLIRRLRSVT